jgi:2-keto-4-pentenoate hydratase
MQRDAAPPNHWSHTMTYDVAAAAHAIVTAHSERQRYANLGGHLAPPTISDAYRVQEALVPLWAPTRGAIAGLKIATTTKVMQQLMGIDHPCGGMIYANTVHQTPARLDRSRFMHLVVECELAVRIGRDLPMKPKPYTRDEVAAAISEVMPAFELIEDRNADYKTCKASSLVADNAWNGGVAPLKGFLLDKIKGTLRINGEALHAGLTDDPLGALAWVANLAADRNRPMTKGMVVITGSVIPTLAIGPPDHFAFELDGFGVVEMTAP